VIQGDLKQQILRYFGEDFTGFYQVYVGECHRISNGDYKILCPLHTETEPSFHYKPKTGKWYCHAEKQGGDIFKFYALKHGLSLNGQFPQILNGIAKDFNIAIDTTKPEERKRVAHYDYTDENGNVVHRTIKYNPKSYKQYAFKEGKGWAWSLKGVQTYLYNLPDVIKKPQVWICEGEKDADTVNSLGIENVVATTNPMGAKKWKKEYNKYFRDKDCILLPDNDEEGRSHMEKIAVSLQGIAKSIKNVSFPDLPHKGDVTDFVEKQKSRQDATEAILKVVNDTEVYKPPPTLAEEIEAMNEKHAVVMVGGKCCVLNETFDPIFKKPDFTLSHPNDLKNYYGNTKVTIYQEGRDEPKKENIASIWLERPERRTFKGIIFDPNSTEVDGFYNLFRGLAVQPSKGKWNYFQDHVYEVISNTDPQIANYILSWMAYKLQNLGQKRCKVSLVLRGEIGAGKGCFAKDHYGALFGSHLVHVINQRHIMGRFNSVVKDALLVYVDEAFWAGDKQATGILKGLITEDTIPIEFKGKDVFQVRNHMDFIMASNNEWVVPAGFKERRFCVLDVSGSKIDDREWFDRIYTQMENGGMEGMLYDLLRIDISKFEPRDFPKTDALIDQVLTTMCTFKKFWYSQLQQGKITKSKSFNTEYDFGDWISTQDFYECYLDYADKLKDRHPITDNVFIREMKKLCPRMRKSRAPSNLDSTRKRGYDIPPLEDCRQAFEKITKMPLKWEETDDD
jgi:5S rRNA maturation endonuclease (ribonuclease M5)